VIRYIDTHAHLYAEEFDTDRSEVITRAIQNGVTKILLPNIDIQSLDGMKILTETYPQNCFAMLGLHPCSVDDQYKSALTKIESAIQKVKIKAIGEIGVDLYWDTTFKNQQIDAFLMQCQWANRLELPVAIHTRNATRETLDALNTLEKQPGGVFHCFGGTLEEAHEIIDLGYSLGIGGVLTYKNSNLATILPHISLDKIVLETDSPYLSPAPYRGKRNESMHIPLIAKKLAEIYDLSIEMVAEKTTYNASQLFKI
jgi:TatD DNase family protein